MGGGKPRGFCHDPGISKEEEGSRPLGLPHKAETIGQEEGVESPFLFLIRGKFNELALFSTLVAAINSKWAQFLDQDFS